MEVGGGRGRGDRELEDALRFFGILWNSLRYSGIL